jgi:hypothetical protein
MESGPIDEIKKHALRESIIIDQNNIRWVSFKEH